MHRRVVTIAGMLLGCTLAQPVVDEPQQRPKWNQQWSGWVFGRMFGVSIPGLGSGSTPPPNVFGWK